MDDIEQCSYRHGRSWSVRASCGETRALSSLVELGRLILRGEIAGDDEISAGDGSWRRVADVIEPESLGLTLQALGHVALRPAA